MDGLGALARLRRNAGARCFRLPRPLVAAATKLVLPARRDCATSERPPSLGGDRKMFVGLIVSRTFTQGAPLRGEPGL
jgi:hypothetical protein